MRFIVSYLLVTAFSVFSFPAQESFFLSKIKNVFPLLRFSCALCLCFSAYLKKI